jgi:hypothetical protein
MLARTWCVEFPTRNLRAAYARRGRRPPYTKCDVPGGWIWLDTQGRVPAAHQPVLWLKSCLTLYLIVSRLMVIR